jgi:hypothetical protein
MDRRKSLDWRKSRHSGNGGNCVEVAKVENESQP